MDMISGALMEAFNFVLGLLPDSPFQAVNNSGVESFLGTLNWFLPMSQIVAELELWVGAIAIFYVYQIILRWVKAIE